MSKKLDRALSRLRVILPLKQKQDSCAEEIKRLHQQVLRSFVTDGTIMKREQMAQYVSGVDHAIRILRDHDMVVFGDDGEPLGAYPFTMDEREHKVNVNGHQVYAMCALDALAVSPMFDMQTHITSRCHITGRPVSIRQSGDTIENIDEAGEVHVGIAWAAAAAGGSCADSLCLEMIYLADSNTARQWLEQDITNREIFMLPEAVEFAGRFFVPLMQ